MILVIFFQIGFLDFMDFWILWILWIWWIWWISWILCFFEFDGFHDNFWFHGFDGFLDFMAFVDFMDFWILWISGQFLISWILWIFFGIFLISYFFTLGNFWTKYGFSESLLGELPSFYPIRWDFTYDRWCLYRCNFYCSGPYV